MYILIWDRYKKKISMDAVGFEPTIIGTYACGLEYLTHISMNYTEPDQRTLILINNILYFI